MLRRIPLLVLARVPALALAATALACGRAPEPGREATRKHVAGAAGDARLRAALSESVQVLDPRTTNVGRRVPDLAFTDVDGRAGRLSGFDGRALVIAVRDTGCPVSQRSAPELARIEAEFRDRDVDFLFLGLSSSDTPAGLRADAAAHGLASALVHDPEQRLGAALGARTTTETFVLDGARTLVYRGAIDDRIGRGTAARAEPRRTLLRDARAAVLARRLVAVPATSAPGCRLAIDAPAAAPDAAAAPTYHTEIARILQRGCVECHRAGGAAPFALETYAAAHGRRAMIALVVESGVMPPWFAADHTGPWANDRRLGASDRAALLAWIAAGAPEGDPADAPLALEHPEGWAIGAPDVVFEMAAPFDVPAEGVVEFRYFEIEPAVERDLWIRALEIRPGAREVVHHVTVSYRASDPDGAGALRRALLPWSQPENDGWVFLYGHLPGKGPTEYPDGIARLLPRGARLRFDVHYTPNGRAVRDRTRLGLVLAEGPPELVAESRNFRDVDIVIPPRASAVAFTREFPVRHDVLLRALTPHMHLRGKTMLAELVRPDGTTEELLALEAWDADWQFEHVFREPRLVMAGSRVHVTAVYDNSSANPDNPDPDAWVRDGAQTTDEMMSLIVEWIRPRVLE
jgi:peroxiredoxin/mono/diheme cytochrome c family protein